MNVVANKTLNIYMINFLGKFLEEELMVKSQEDFFKAFDAFV